MSFSLLRSENDFSLLADGRAAIQFTSWHRYRLALPGVFWSTGPLRASQRSLEGVSDAEEDGEEPSGLDVSSIMVLQNTKQC